jgi:hypothetical protein
MRFARKLVLLSAMALAALALTASSASAVTVHPEPSGSCGTVTNAPNGHGTPSGGCTVNAVNTEPIELGTSLSMILCDNEFEAKVGGNGEGFIYGHDIFNCTSSVNECNESGVPDNWPVHLNTEASMEAQFCVVAFGFITINCHLPNVHVNQITHSEVEFSTLGIHQFCEGSDTNSVEGHWLALADEAHPPLVIEH